jgi:hypothetical protein
MNQEDLKAFLIYYPDSGKFIRIRDNREIGHAWNVGFGRIYRRICISGKGYLAHRLAWLYIHGSMPEKPMMIDHIDGDGENNKISNLRCVDALGNMKNTKLSSNNKSGISGVRWDSKINRWAVTIGHNGDHISLGRHKDKFEACCARKSAEIKYGYHENHGTKRIKPKKKPKKVIVGITASLLRAIKRNLGSFN